MTLHLPAIAIQCPACQAQVDVPLTAILTTDEGGRQTLLVDPDMADLWAHAWTHEGQAGAQGEA